MNLRHIEVFYAIMQAGSVTGAAHLLNVTQPAVSNVLRHAEQQLGLKLFERIAGRLQPTPEAYDIFPDVQEIFGRIGTLNRMVEEMQGGRTGRLAIAASPTLVNAYLPKAIARLKTRAAQVTIQSLPTAIAIERVARREVDIGFVYGPVIDPGVVMEALGGSDLVCALHRRSPLAKHKVLEPRHLASATVVSTGRSTRIGVAVKEACEAHGLPTPTVSVEVNSSLAACLMAAEDVGVGLVDLATVNQYALPNVVFRPFWPQVELHLCLIFPKDRPKSRATVRFADALRELVAAGPRTRAAG
ncbi:LysR family transcriptional regulator [Bordetella sp. BOR01]|uniref:LysR family transcriptional regulator n=1 Tax=Bordetella sp. BOR01 TaxID=2854779 RepID=UPI001C46A0BE|nr:LysR substrate-binding domain-containing protein [Bordetella sp. BOR01]MBV7484995.1 LysR family transcriptional regulator [Bordetella sp. BOR01]